MRQRDCQHPRPKRCGFSLVALFLRHRVSLSARAGSRRRSCSSRFLHHVSVLPPNRCDLCYTTHLHVGLVCLSFAVGIVGPTGCGWIRSRTRLSASVGFSVRHKVWDQKYAGRRPPGEMFVFVLRCVDGLLGVFYFYFLFYCIQGAPFWGLQLLACATEVARVRMKYVFHEFGNNNDTKTAKQQQQQTSIEVQRCNTCSDRFPPKNQPCNPFPGRSCGILTLQPLTYRDPTRSVPVRARIGWVKSCDKQMLMNLHREQWTQGLVMKRFEDHQTSNEKTVEVCAILRVVAGPLELKTFWTS